MSPTERSLKRLRAEGYLVQVVERWNAFARRRVDLFGFIDLLAVKEGQTLAIQATSASNVSARVKKIAEHENVGFVRKAGWRVEVWGWAKGKKEPRVVDCS